MNKICLLLSGLAIAACDPSNSTPLDVELDVLDVLDAPGKADGTNAGTSVVVEPSADGKIINVRGFAAAELFEAMEVAGLEVEARPGYEVVSGQFVACAANASAAHCVMASQTDLHEMSPGSTTNLAAFADSDQGAAEIGEILEAAQAEDSFIGWNWQCGNASYQLLGQQICRVRQDTGRLAWSFRNLELPPTGHLYGVWMELDDGQLIHVGRTDGADTTPTGGQIASFFNVGTLNVGPEIGRHVARGFLTLESNATFSPTQLGEVLFSGNTESTGYEHGSFTGLGVKAHVGFDPGGIRAMSF